VKITAIEKGDAASPRWGRPLRELRSKDPIPRADLTPPISATDPVTDNVPLCHWHLVGGRWRPLHEQLNVLSDAATWIRAWAPESPSSSGIAEPVELAEELILASVQCGHEYAARGTFSQRTDRPSYSEEPIPTTWFPSASNNPR
jgi:hypothetical protein